MTQLFGKTYSRGELLSRVGSVSQLAEVRLCELADGPGRGVRTAEFRTGSGLRFSVYLDRGMDIGPADYQGRPLAWVSPVGPVHPAHHEPQGVGFLRTFHGGLLTGCGLTSVGPGGEDQGEQLGLHGRLSHTPATIVSYGGRWEGDEYLLWVEGQVREAAVFGADLVLTRRISATLGGRQVVIEDRVRNEGWQVAPNEMLYHINFGFPVVSAASELLMRTESTSSRDPVRGNALYDSFQEPTPGFAEHVLDHILRPDPGGYGHAAVVNRELQFGVHLQVRLAELPRLLEWKVMAEGTYVVGLEPANCGVRGRARDREEGTLLTLQPGEEVGYRIVIEVLPDATAISQCEQIIRAV